MIIFKVYQKMAERGFHTRQSLADAAGINPTNLGRIVKGKVTRIDVETIDKLCRALDCQPGDLLEYAPDPSQA